MSGSLVSPGVLVQVNNESFYNGGTPGTVPLIVIATASNKASPSGTGIAPWTVPSQAGKLFSATSQRDLIQSFGNPIFKSVQGTQIHGDETNEYGLHAGYSFMGIQNRAYFIRAEIDLAQLEPAETPPVGAPIPGTYWLDTTNTSWGLFRSTGAVLPGNAWVSVPVKTPASTDLLSNVPKTSYGSNGDFAVVTETASNYYYEKISGTWYQIGSTAWKTHKPTVVTGTTVSSTVPSTSSFSINGTTVTLTVNPSTLSNVVTAINAANITGIVASNPSTSLVITNTNGGNIVLANVSGTPLTTLGMVAGTTYGNKAIITSDAQYPANSVAGDLWVKGTTPNNGANYVVRYYSSATSTFGLVATPFYVFDSTKTDGDVTKDAAAIAALGNPTVGSVYVGYDITTGDKQLRRWAGSTIGWQSLVYEASPVAPYTAPSDGTLWFDNQSQVDIMVSTGSQWFAYNRQYSSCDPNGVQLSATAPTLQSDSTPLVQNDLWIDTSDTENYPALYRWDATARRWRAIDKTDHTTPFGIIFGDARSNSGVTFTGIANPGTYAYSSTLAVDMVLSDFLDPDAPDPRLHPAGTLLFNTRYSSNNVKKWTANYFNPGGFDPNTDFTVSTYTVGSTTYTFPSLSTPGTWVTASGNNESGVAYMGRKSQRAMVVKAMAAVLVANQDIRSELAYYNLIAAPGYTELLSEMVTLNTDQKEVSFIVGDTPIRLPADGTSLQNWSTNALNAAVDGDTGLLTQNENVGIYYPWGLGTNVDGSEIMIPPSTIALRTIAYNDQVAYPWFAPAGFTRGLVTNASSVGYLDKSGDYVPVLLNNGQRDVLYINKVNPIAYIPNRGLVVYGQKTLSPLSSALDRINVARLVNYLRYSLHNLVQPYLFEQNDNITRAAAKHTVERFLNGLIGLRALTDYAVLCDLTNNTPDRIDQNQLWIDIAIIPEKSVEFIIIPIRILNTGASLTA